jgi:copper chaperone NosL
MHFSQIIKFTGVAAIIVIVAACNPESKPIDYGADKCEFCRMSIVDKRFGGEIVTQKGKIFKFDAMECMVNYLDEHVEDESKLKFILTNTYDHPGELHNATVCTYLKSENMPSPMGKFLNPFKDSEEATRFQIQNTGSIFSWGELRADFDKNK